MNLFDPETYRGLRRPVHEAETLPAECYTSEEFYRREVECIFMKTWNCIGREDFIKKPGDYFTHNLVDVDLIVIRGRDNKVRAFANTCRHRGAKLLEGDGHCAAIHCPYHGWAYNLDGSLLAFNEMEDAKDLDGKKFGLLEVKLETWLGFIFVNFDPQCEPLSAFLGNLGHFLDSYGIEEMITVRRKEVRIKTNWKSYCENSIEPIHLPLVHKKTIGHVFASNKSGMKMTAGTGGNFFVMQTLTDRSRAVLKGDKGFDKLPGLRGPAAGGAQYIHVNPCTVIGADLDCMWFKHMQPDGHDMVRNVAAFCFPKSALERPDYEEIIVNYHKRFDLVMDEDSAIAETQFLGMKNPLGVVGRFSPFEKGVHHFDNWVIDQVVGREPVEQQVAAE